MPNAVVPAAAEGLPEIIPGGEVFSRRAMLRGLAVALPTLPAATLAAEKKGVSVTPLPQGRAVMAVAGRVVTVELAALPPVNWEDDAEYVVMTWDGVVEVANVFRGGSDADRGKRFAWTNSHPVDGPDGIWVSYGVTVIGRIVQAGEA